VKKIIYILPFILLTLLGCGTKVNEEYLIGGTWVATTGYEESKVKDIPYCIQFMMEGLEFKDEEFIYSSYFDEDYTYFLDNSKKPTLIRIDRDISVYGYDIRKIDKNTIELAGRNTDPNKEFCTLERKE